MCKGVIIIFDYEIDNYLREKQYCITQPDLEYIVSTSPQITSDDENNIAKRNGIQFGYKCENQYDGCCRYVIRSRYNNNWDIIVDNYNK
jgi:hypothetical protein